MIINKQSIELNAYNNNHLNGYAEMLADWAVDLWLKHNGGGGGGGAC